MRTQTRKTTHNQIDNEALENILSSNEIFEKKNCYELPKNLLF